MRGGVGDVDDRIELPNAVGAEPDVLLLLCWCRNASEEGAQEREGWGGGPALGAGLRWSGGRKVDGKPEGLDSLLEGGWSCSEMVRMKAVEQEEGTARTAEIGKELIGRRVGAQLERRDKLVPEVRWHGLDLGILVRVARDGRVADVWSPRVGRREQRVGGCPEIDWSAFIVL